MGEIEQRLSVLERTLQRSQHTNRMLLLLVVVIACAAGAQRNPSERPEAPPPKAAAKSSKADSPEGRRAEGRDRSRIVEAEGIVLRDQRGRLRTKMIAADDGSAIRMFDKEGRKRLELRQTSSESGFRIFGSDESLIASLLQVPGKAASAQFEINGQQGKTLVQADGLSVRDAADHQRLHFALINGNFPVLGIRQSGETGPPSVEVTPRSLTLHDGGYPRFAMSTAADGRAFLNLRHPDRERSLQISTGPSDGSGPTIGFFAPSHEDGSGGQLPYLRIGLDSTRQPYIRITGSDGQPLFTAPTQ